MWGYVYRTQKSCGRGLSIHHLRAMATQVEGGGIVLDGTALAKSIIIISFVQLQHLIILPDPSVTALQSALDLCRPLILFSSLVWPSFRLDNAPIRRYMSE